MADVDSMASRLCSACGMCCNGALFYTVHLKPGDSAKALSALGLKLKKKRGQLYLLQPCPAHREGACAIYMNRPTRCCLFRCRLLTQLDDGVILESEAMDRVQEAKARLARLNRLLEQLGNTKTGQPLFKRCESVLATPPDSPDSRTTQQALLQAKHNLDALLEDQFRMPPPEEESTSG